MSGDGAAVSDGRSRMAFVVEVGAVSGSARQLRRAGLCPRRAENDGNDVKDVAPGEKKLSLQERMALSLGRDVDEEKQKFEEEKKMVEERTRVEKRNAYIKAGIGATLGAAYFFLDTFSLSNPLTILHGLEAVSPTYEVAMANEKPTVLEFYADWCGVCKEMAPRMEKLEQSYADKVNFVVRNGADPSNQELTTKYHVDGVPHISLLGSDGKVATTFIGRVPGEVLQQDIDALLEGKELPYIGFDLDELYSEEYY